MANEPATKPMFREDRETQASSGSQVRDAAAKVTQTAQDAYERVSEAAQDTLERGTRVVQEQRERYPEADRYLRQGSAYVREPVRDNPVLAICLAGALGYGLAYLFHARRSEQLNSEVPDYARSRTRYRYERN